MKANEHRVFPNLSLFCIGLLLSGIHLPAYALTEGDYTYDVADGAATITGFNTSFAGALAITNTLGGCPVVRIGPSAFESCDGLAGLTIPDSVTDIGDDAFSSCVGLTNAVIGNQVTRIGAGAFFDCTGLSRLVIPDSVTNIGPFAFSLAGLTAISIPYGVTQIEDSLFGHCYRLTSVNIPDSVTSIGTYAFNGCALKSLVIPASVTRIGNFAFQINPNLTNVFFMGNAPSVGAGVFSLTPATVYYPARTTGWGPTFGGLPAALWKLTVYFDAMGGSVSPSSVLIGQNAYYGSLPKPVRAGYSFRGWWTGADGTGARVTDNTVFSATEKQTLYAFWRQYPPVISQWAPSADPAPVNEGSSVAFSVTASDSDDDDESWRGMSNVVWTVDGDLARMTSTSVLGVITSAFAYTSTPATVKGVVYRDVSVRALARDRQGITSEKAWTVRVNNVAVPQRITFGFIAAKAFGDSDFAPGATASSGLPVTYSSSNESVATIVGGQVHIVGAGTSVITVNQSGSLDYVAATPVSRTLTVRALLSAEVPGGGGTVIGTGLYAPGARVVLSARPNTGYTFLRWDDGSQTFTRNLVMPNANAMTVSAWFGVTTNVPQPVIADPGSQRTMVGVPFTLPLDIQSASQPSVTLTGLPMGLAYNASIRSVTGVPTASVTNKVVTVTARNVNKVPAVKTFTMTVDPLTAWAQGTFNGTAGTESLGSGSAAMSVTAKGESSGKVTLRGTNFSFTAKNYASRGVDGSFTLVTTAKVGRASLPLSLSVSAPVITDASGIVPPTLSKVDGALSTNGWMALYRDVWKDAGMVAVLTNRFAGYYTAVLPGGAEYGSGYLAFTVDKTGAVKTAGKLADGTSISLSGTLVLDEEGRAWTVLYASPMAYKGGGIFGATEFHKASEEAKVIVRPLDSEPFAWQSFNPQATQAYGEGFTRDLTIDGGWYDTVGNLYRYYEDKALSAGTDPAAAAPEVMVMTNRFDSVWWNPDGVAVSVVTNASGAMTGLAAPKAGAPIGSGTSYDYSTPTNAVGLTIRLTRRTGLFTGTFKAWFDYGATHTSKSVSYEGVLTPERPDTSDTIAGRGFFLWADKAIPPAPARAYSFSWSYDFSILLSEPVP